MESFFDFYELHNSTNKILPFRSSPSIKRCRFCNEQYPSVTFNNVPHLVPELFGRNNLTSNFECDKCNKKFQKFENDTATMIQHYLALLNIKTKKGTPTFQSVKIPYGNSTILKSINNSRNLNFGTNLNDFNYDEQEKSLTIKFRTKKFRPFSVYKIFLKMGLSLLTEEELKTNRHYFEFLNSEEPIMNGMQIWTIQRYMLKTKFHLIPNVNLYRAKKTLINNTEFPEYVLLINFANIIFQFFLPISIKNINEHNDENRLNLELFPSFVLDDITRLKEIDMYSLELNETNKISITDKVILYYEKKETSQLNKSI
ncbi:MAG: hypothetical protein J0I09_10510 [Sphingobacteriia bacterium]|nr:hypothetical protein [Sphingobacteriia bacterium]